MKLGKPYTDDGVVYQNVIDWDTEDRSPEGLQFMFVPTDGPGHWQVCSRTIDPAMDARYKYRVPAPPEPTWSDVWKVCNKCEAVEGYHGSRRWIKFKTPADALQAVKAVQK